MQKWAGGAEGLQAGEGSRQHVIEREKKRDWIWLKGSCSNTAYITLNSIDSITPRPHPNFACPPQFSLVPWDLALGTALIWILVERQINVCYNLDVEVKSYMSKATSS